MKRHEQRVVPAGLERYALPRHGPNQQVNGQVGCPVQHRQALHQAHPRDPGRGARGRGDVEGNPALSLAVQKAKDASMPKDNIERAIAKGTGADQDGVELETIVYEGYGPGGVPVLVEALTDNRNRTGSEVRHAFSTHNGNLGEPGSVAWIFEKKGEIVVDGSRYSEDDLMAAIDAGAEDVALDGDVYEIVTGPRELAAVRAALEEAGVELESAEVVQRPTTTTPVEEDTARTLMRLLDTLEENDDVQDVHANFDIAPDVLERVAA